MANVFSPGRLSDSIKSFDTLNEKNKRAFFVAALLASLIILAWFLFHISHGILYADEAFYLTVADKLTKGDKLILNEWQLTQFTVFFLYIPYRLFTLITGSTDGVILFMRLVYTFVNLLTYWYIIIKLRKHPLKALISAFLFCWFVPLIYACNYYTLPNCFALYSCMILMSTGDKFRPLKFIFVGILIASSVLMSPGIAVVWLIYVIAVAAAFVSRKRGGSLFSDYDFVLNINIFKWILAGVMISAAAFVVYMQLSAGWQEIIKMIPYLLSDPEYDTSVGGNLYSFFWIKLWETIVYYNPVLSALLLVLTAYIVFFRKKILTDTKRKTLLFAAVTVCIVIMHLHSLFKKQAGAYPSVFYLEDAPLPLAWLCFNVHFLTKEQNKKLFLFWMVGVAVSIARDALSDVSFGTGLILCVIPLVYMLPSLVSEVREDLSSEAKKNKKSKSKTPAKTVHSLEKLATSSLILIIAMTSVWCVTNKYYISRDMIEKEGVSSCTQKLEKGPHKGIYTSVEVKTKLYAYFNDLDRIASMTDRAPHITGMMPYAFLYLNRPYTMYTAYIYASDDMKFEERIDTYWQLYPEKRPDVVYIPAEPIPYQAHPKYISSKEFDSLPEQSFVSFDWFEGTAIKGEGGVIFKVSKWKTPKEWN